nr:hypothetical protein [Parasphaerochaeta coccoides]
MSEEGYALEGIEVEFRVRQRLVGLGVAGKLYQLQSDSFLGESRNDGNPLVILPPECH